MVDEPRVVVAIALVRSERGSALQLTHVDARGRAGVHVFTLTREQWLSLRRFADSAL